MTPALSPFRIQKFLGGLRYPAGKGQVLDHARQRGADGLVLRALDSVPDREYESPVALARAVGERSSPRAALKPLPP